MRTMKKHLRRAAVVLFVLCGLAIFAYVVNSRMEEAVSDKQIEMAETVPEDSDVENEQAPTMEFDVLKNQNGDIKAWLRIDGLGINYPIVQAPDNIYYLTHTAERKKNRLGALFMDYRCSDDFSDFNTVIYGHNMKSGKMFGKLGNMKESEAFNAVKTGVLYTQQGTFKLAFFAVVVADAYSPLYSYIFPDPSVKLQHLQTIEQTAMQYRAGIADQNSRILALSTCSYEFKDARTIVMARMIEK